MSDIVRSQVIGKTAGYRESMEAREESRQIDRRLEKARKKWTFYPPTNMTILYQGAVLSVPHDVGRMLLHKRLAWIIEHDVNIDAVIDGSLEEFVAMGGLN